MKGQVKIGTKNVEMVANAATPVFFNQVFHEDFFTELGKFTEEGNSMRSAEIYGKIGFICANQAKKGFDGTGLSYKDYVGWLEQFMLMDLAEASDDIAEIFFAQAQETATPKK